MRKTLAIETMKEQANAFFRNSANESIKERYAIQHFVAHLLMEAKAYKGFNYLTKNQVDSDKTIGVSYSVDNKPTFFDESRIYFF